MCYQCVYSVSRAVFSSRCFYYTQQNIRSDLGAMKLKDGSYSSPTFTMRNKNEKLLWVRVRLISVLATSQSNGVLSCREIISEPSFELL